MLDEGLITADTARARTTLLNRDTLATPRIVAGDGVVPVPLARAVPASSGIASGEIALLTKRAWRLAVAPAYPSYCCVVTRRPAI